METKFNFNSQVCTSRSQSERLLALGLKKETADMVLLKEMVYDEQEHCLKDGEGYIIRPIDYLEGEEHRGHIPAWSLHRLIEMVSNSDAYGKGDWLRGIAYNAYEDIIESIGTMIYYGYFNKEYLVNQAEVDEHCKGVLEYLDYIRED